MAECLFRDRERGRREPGLLQGPIPLPGVEKRRKVGDREALIDQLWSAIEALPEPEPQSDTRRPSKQNAVIAMLRRSEDAKVEERSGANDAGSIS
jgi:hypothetical protein